MRAYVSGLLLQLPVQTFQRFWVCKLQIKTLKCSTLFSQKHKHRLHKIKQPRGVLVAHWQGSNMRPGSFWFLIWGSNFNTSITHTSESFTGSKIEKWGCLLPPWLSSFNSTWNRSDFIRSRLYRWFFKKTKKSFKVSSWKKWDAASL